MIFYLHNNLEKKHKRKHRKALHSEIDDKVKPFSETEEFPSRNQFNSQGSSHLNRVSSRGNSEDSESAYNGHKLNSRPVLSLSKSRNSRGIKLEWFLIFKANFVICLN